MSAPERIWTWDFCASEQNEFMRGGWFVEPSRGDTEYIRADIHEAEVARLRGVAISTAASLAAAISLLERGGKAAKKAAPSDKMFDQMLTDYRNSLDAARAALGDDA